jgi:uncharacterized protein (TIGR02996 family)
MTHDEAFLQAMLEAPEDQTPRLIYADWLEEQGDSERGEFIRLQAQLAGLAADDPRRPALDERERRLFAELALSWPRSPRDRATAFAYCRRFMRGDAVSAAAYLAHPTVFRAAPLGAFHLDLTGLQVPVEVIEYCPESVARENLLLPLAVQGGAMTFALRDPVDQELVQKLQFVFNRDVDAVPAPARQIAAAIERHYPWDDTVTITATIQGDSLVWEAGEPPAPDAAVIAKLVDVIIQEARALRATEVHIRPGAGCFQVRYRIDGAWVERDRPPHRLLAPVVARLREMAGLHRRSGKGRVAGAAGGRPFDLLLRVIELGDGPHVLLTL